MIGDLIGEWIKGILIDGIMGNLSGLFNSCLLYTSNRPLERQQEPRHRPGVLGAEKGTGRAGQAERPHDCR